MEFQRNSTLLGQILFEYGVITKEQLAEVTASSLTSDAKIGERFISSGYATQAQIDAALVEQRRRREFVCFR